MATRNGAQASSVMEERLSLCGPLARRRAACPDFVISRKTGSKIVDRYKEHGLKER
jgi:hypothetical protein